MVKIITAATEEPLTLAEAKVFLRVDVTDDDALITGLISAAREYAEHYTGATFATVEYELALDAFPADAIALPNPPVSAVASVKYTDTAGVEQTIDPDSYVLADYGMVPSIYPLDPWPSVGAYPNPVRVRYTASGAAVPAVVKVAMLELVAYYYEHRDDAGAVPAAITRLLDVPKVYA